VVNIRASGESGSREVVGRGKLGIEDFSKMDNKGGENAEVLPHLLYRSVPAFSSPYTTTTTTTDILIHLTLRERQD